MLSGLYNNELCHPVVLFGQDRVRPEDTCTKDYYYLYCLVSQPGRHQLHILLVVRGQIGIRLNYISLIGWGPIAAQLQSGGGYKGDLPGNQIFSLNLCPKHSITLSTGALANPLCRQLSTYYCIMQVQINSCPDNNCSFSQSPTTVVNADHLLVLSFVNCVRIIILICADSTR